MRARKKRPTLRGEASIKTIDGRNYAVIFSNGHKETLKNTKELKEYLSWYKKKTPNKETI